MTQPTAFADAGTPSWVRWAAVLFGIATVGFLVQGINRAYIATQLGAADGTYSVEYVAKTTQSILGALVCLTAATMPFVWWHLTHPRMQRIATEPVIGHGTRWDGEAVVFDSEGRGWLMGRDYPMDSLAGLP